MRLLHFSQKSTLRPIVTVPQVTGLDMMRLTVGKPRGLWVTPEGDDNDWSWWARAESFRLEDLRHALEVKLRADARILHLESVQDMIEFAATYLGALNSETSQFLAMLPRGDEPITRVRYAGINWHAVSREYQGIVIAPYQWELRLDERFFWYYAWDCASGCVWDAAAVESMTPRPDVMVVTEAEIRRSIHQRMRYTRRKRKKLMRRLDRDLVA